jgi:hypothetical protein
MYNILYVYYIYIYNYTYICIYSHTQMCTRISIYMYVINLIFGIQLY